MILLAKSKTTKTPVKRKKKTANEKWQFAIGETVIYIGGLYSEYKNKEIVLKDRYRQHLKEYYVFKSFEGNDLATIGTALKKIESDSKEGEGEKCDS